MSRFLKTLMGGLLALALAQAPALAMGPVDGEFGILWWQTDFARNTDIEDVSADAGAPGYRGELWFFNKLGVRAAMLSSDLGDINEDDAESISADVLWRVFGPTENSFLAVGLGWHDMDFTEGALSPMLVETSGPRIAAEGRVGVLAMLYLYGTLAILPEMDDYQQDSGSDTFTDLEGQEYELGVSWKMSPFVDMRAGYRSSELDFTRQQLLSSDYQGSIENEGFMVGFGFHF